MQPQMADKIEKITRKDFPDGIPAYGTDALRFTFAALASTGRDINFDLGRIEGYRNFCNKLWNAARYVLLNTEGHDCGQDGGDIELSAADRWIVAQLQTTVQTVIDAIENYRFDHAAQAMYAFIWDEYCDWYLELSKPLLTGDGSSAAALRGTRRTLVRVMEAVLRLIHPLVPFISEEIWQRMAPLAGIEDRTIMLRPYPTPEPDAIDSDAIAEIDWVKAFINGVRKVRSGMNIDPRRMLPVLLEGGREADRDRLERNHRYLETVGRIESVTWLEAENTAPESSTALVGNMKLLIPLAGLIDKEAEIARLGKELERAGNELNGCDRKLANAGFVDKAPAEVVDKVRSRATDLRATIGNLEAQLEKIRAL
jgi:valyl-tRNA synthetase